MNTSHLTILALLGGLASLTVQGDEPDFNRDVQPILSDKCYFCHGPDAAQRQADLRLDTFAGSREVVESGDLLERIASDDPDVRMPPAETKLFLSNEEKEILKSWVQNGAPFQEHWAFQPIPGTIPIPISTRDNWSKKTLDRFVWNSLAEQGLKPNQEAEPLRWLRRVTFDLTGLPPTLEALDQFLQSLERSDPDSVYQEVVDGLLASPAYGEQMAVAWLDAARYADSYGYQSDRLNTQWPYRDWVVTAFNENLPYDDFITWQLAGDLLENPTRDQRLATAFNRIHRLNNEGGAVFEEWRLENVADRVQTFGTAILGLTLECCRCHDHKYDPIPTRDFYSLSAFFNSIDENGVYDNSEKVPAPSLLLPTKEQSLKLEQTRRALDQAEAEYNGVIAEARQRFGDWKPDPESLSRISGAIRTISFDVPYQPELKEVYYPGTGAGSQTQDLELVNVTGNSLPRLDPLASDDGAILLDEREHALPRRAVKLDGDRGIVMPGMDHFDRWTPFTITIGLKETRRSVEPTVIAQCSSGQLAFNGWDLMISNGYLQLRMYREWPGNAIAVRSTTAVAANQWLQVSAIYDGSSRATGLKIYVNGAELETEVVRDKIKKKVMSTVHHGGKLTIGQRFRDRGLAGGLIDDVRVFNRALTPPEVKRLATGAAIDANEEFFINVVDQPASKAFEQLTRARKAYVMAEEVAHEIPVMEEMRHPRQTHVLARGEYNASTSDATRVDTATLSSIGPGFPAHAPRNRLGLAQWVTLPDHPLTARVIVNRLWSNFFGHGLVRTPEDFGRQGQVPTHPQLLDWLARDFIEHDWDIKRLCRNIVLSATYRQDSRAPQELRSADPHNRWLARGPAHRLSSEQIRDLALASSGLLNPKQGGPPVSPYQAGGDLWRESNTMSPAYHQSVGQDLYRRSLYSVWKRTAPLPNMLAFDAQSREVCMVKRSRTNTPLQALVLMNDRQFVEAARALAEQVSKTGTLMPERIGMAFRKLTGRSPDDDESRLLHELFESELTHYQVDKTAAEQLITFGESKPDESIDPIELAALTIVCQVIMNLDATIWKR